MNEANPIDYRGEITVRFGDLDPYGHVNATNYLDYVISSRWLFAKEKLSITAKDFIDKGVGFFMTDSNISYRKSIYGVQRIGVTSHVSEIQGTTKVVTFSIMSSDWQKLFATGNLRFAIMDLTTMKPQPMPDWIIPYFINVGVKSEQL